MKTGGGSSCRQEVVHGLVVVDQDGLGARHDLVFRASGLDECDEAVALLDLDGGVVVDEAVVQGEEDEGGNFDPIRILPGLLRGGEGGLEPGPGRLRHPQEDVVVAHVLDVLPALPACRVRGLEAFLLGEDGEAVLVLSHAAHEGGHRCGKGLGRVCDLQFEHGGGEHEPVVVGGIALGEEGRDASSHAVAEKEVWDVLLLGCDLIADAFQIFDVGVEAVDVDRAVLLCDAHRAGVAPVFVGQRAVAQVEEVVGELTVLVHAFAEAVDDRDEALGLVCPVEGVVEACGGVACLLSA